MPDINHETPEALEYFHHQVVDGISIYVSKEAAVGATCIKFNLRGIWLFKRFVASGIEFPRI